MFEQQKFLIEIELIWNQILSEVQTLIHKEPVLIGLYYSCILNQKDFSSALSYILSIKLGDKIVSTISIRDIIDKIYSSNNLVILSAIKDIQAIYRRDPVIKCYSIPLLYLKEFHALQSYRISHYLWNTGRRELAIYFQNRISVVFSVDIHPASVIGNGIILDHATGIVIGGITTIKNDTSSLSTLDDTGYVKKVNYPIINEEVIIGAGAKILGNIEVGSNVKINAGSIVLASVPPNSIVSGTFVK
ncbi:MAG: serine O-acetyltransferase [Buchnera aphidicola (Melaphis rhois)]